jgi:hypothetical protein
VELGWVLGAAPGWDATRVHRALEALLNMEGIEVEAAAIAKEGRGRKAWGRCRMGLKPAK